MGNRWGGFALTENRFKFVGRTVKCLRFMEIFVNSQLQNEHHFSATFENIFESHNVWMLDSLEDLHLSLHAAPVQAKTAACNLPNLQEFACPKVPRGPLPNLANLAKMPTVQGKDRIHKKHQAWHASKILCPGKYDFFC